METNYSQYRAKALHEGQFYQDFALDVLWQLGLGLNQYHSQFYQYAAGEGRAGIEVKYDRKYAETRNLWIEVTEKGQPRAGDYVPAGIFRANGSWLYLIGNFETVFIFTTKFLRQLSKSLCPLSKLPRYPIIENRLRTSEGFLLGNKDAHKYAGKVIEINGAYCITNGLDAEAARQLHELVCGKEKHGGCG